MESSRSLPPSKAPYEMCLDAAVTALQSQSPCKPPAGFQGQGSHTRRRGLLLLGWLYTNHPVRLVLIQLHVSLADWALLIVAC